MPKLTFNPIEHTYRIDGVLIPGFSQVAKAMGINDFSGVPVNILEAARSFGDNLHYTTKLFDEKNLEESSLSQPLIPCLDQYKQFLKDNAVKIIRKYIEKPICSFRYRYGITPDRICLIGGEFAVLEIKTTTVIPKSVKLQTAAQVLAIEEYYGIRIKKRYGLQIPVEGKYKLFAYTDDNDKSSWLCFLGAYNWLKENKK